VRVATHSGSFHADDVFAIAVLRMVHPDLEIVRSRDPDALAACDLRVDVGGRDDPATGDYDHHQRGGAGARPNGIRYASFGLVWRHHGEALAGGAEAAEAIDQRIVQGVDANDTGQTIVEPLVGDVRPMTVSGVVAGLNPLWDEELTPEQEDRRFEEAVRLAQEIMEREVRGAAAWQRARALVREAIDRAEDPRVVELERNMPWREPLVTGAPDARFVTYPKSDGWGVVAVPRALGSFENRIAFPEPWRGRSGEQLAAATGVGDAVFCHPAGFYASAASRDGALALARLALEEDEGRS
jgi:uncharacterized UPF0160 family protein